MSPRLKVGVNLNFAKFVYGQKRALEVVRKELGLRFVEGVPDMDFGTVFFHKDPEAFRSYHRGVAEAGRRLGVSIESVLTFYRDMGAIAHPHPIIRESAYEVGRVLIETAACYGARYASGSPFTMNREDAEDPERFRELSEAAVAIWKRWMSDAHGLGINRMLIEMAAALREGCSTISGTREMLEVLDAHHRENPESTVPVGVCYDVGHGVAEAESADPRDRDFDAWFEAFPDRIHEVHLKDTDPEFQATWHFSEKKGIIDLERLIASIRDRLTVEDVLLFIEVPGKRGRLIGEERNIEQHKASLSLLTDALEANGYREDGDSGVWKI